MGHGEALAILAGHHAVGRYRQLCADDNPDAEQRDAYRALVIRMALDDPIEPDRPPVAESLALAQAMGACPYRSTKGCGCAGARCALRGATVSHVDCFDCLRRYPE